MLFFSNTYQLQLNMHKNNTRKKRNTLVWENTKLLSSVVPIHVLLKRQVQECKTTNNTWHTTTNVSNSITIP